MNNSLKAQNLQENMKHYCLTCRTETEVDVINLLVATNDYDKICFKCHCCRDHFIIWTDYFKSKQQREKNDREKKTYCQETSCGEKRSRNHSP